LGRRLLLELTRFVAARLTTAPFLVVVTYRSVDAASSETFDDVLASLARQPMLKRITLTGLTESEVGRFIAQTVDVEPVTTIVSAVHARTEGNPFFVGELARLLKTEGLLGGGSGRDGSQGVVRTGVRDVVRRRLARLPTASREALVLGAVIGREFDLAVLAAAAGLGEVDTLDRVGPAIDAGLVSEDGASVGRFRFSHALIRDTVYGELSALGRPRCTPRLAQPSSGTPSPGLALRSWRDTSSTPPRCWAPNVAWPTSWRRPRRYRPPWPTSGPMMIYGERSASSISCRSALTGWRGSSTCKTGWSRS